MLNREDASDGHKHRLLNNFIRAAIDQTKLAGSQAAQNIRRALTSKQYYSVITTLGQHTKNVEEHQYLPTELGEYPIDTLRSQTRSFDKILKIRLSELSHG